MSRRRSTPAAVLAAVAACGLLAPSARAATPPACPAAVTAPSAIVMEVSTREIACAKSPDLRRPIASTTKLMTALLTLEHAKLGQSFRTSDYRPAAGESVIGLLPGERMQVRDLLRGLLVYSGNDAAMALATGVSGSPHAFVRLMNRRARELGLRDTHYANPIGLDAPGNYSTARDLARLAMILRTNPFARATVDATHVTLKSGAHPRTFNNRNRLVRSYAWVNGVKTGHTRAAGYVLVGSARRHGVQVVSAVLGTPGESARDAESLALLTAGVRAFQDITAARPGMHVNGLGRVPIRYRTGAGLALLVGPNQVHAVVPRGRRELVVVKPLTVPAELEGPIRRGQQLGTAEVLRSGKRIAVVPLVAAGPIPAAGVGQRVKSWLTRPLSVMLAFAVLGGTVLLARRGRGDRSPRRPRRETTTA